MQIVYIYKYTCPKFRDELVLKCFIEKWIIIEDIIT